MTDSRMHNELSAAEAVSTYPYKTEKLGKNRDFAEYQFSPLTGQT